MAGVIRHVQLSARLSSRCTAKRVAQRGFRSSMQNRGAQNFPMPALSPTMTEGNIAEWKIKEGDSFSAGDVILEIETDKATMDVEAQDDGKLFRIMQGDGTKSVKVGERIAVFAEAEDDLSSLEVPAEDKSASKSEQKSEQKSEPAPKEEQQNASSKSQSNASQKDKPQQSEGQQGGEAKKQTYPLFPSVQQLLRENGYSNAEADKIPATGPGGRLLKGDVLAYIGKISKDYPAKSSARLAKLSHLDLSNIQLATPAPKADSSKPSSSKSEPPPPQATEIAVPVSLSAVIATQKRVQDTLGIFLPLSVFIARASELANEDLPASRHNKPTATDLFNSVLGLDQVAQSGRGHYVPQIAGITPAQVAVAPVKKPDIIDMLTSKKVAAPKPSVVRAAPIGVSTSANVFSVLAKPGDEYRATEYLERMKVALEQEPGRLVL